MVTKLILIAITLLGAGAATVIVIRERETRPPAEVTPANTAPPLLRPATAQERKVLNSMVTVAPKQRGGMH